MTNTMKHWYLLAAIPALALTSCNNEGKIKHLLQGKWQVTKFTNTEMNRIMDSLKQVLATTKDSAELAKTNQEMAMEAMFIETAKNPGGGI